MSLLGHMPRQPAPSPTVADLAAVAQQSDAEDDLFFEEETESSTMSADDSEGEWKETIIYGEDGPWPSIHLMG